MVLFITGRCGRECWYCPLARERKGADGIRANDREVDSPLDAVEEARQMSALGTSITGGEPLLVLDRVVKYTTALKEAFGPRHHIHLYTALAPNEAILQRLQGLVDEIRLHPPPKEWPTILDSPHLASVLLAKKLGFRAGFEVPGLEGVALLAVALPHLHFLNVNELEWGELSADEMRERGLELADGFHNAVKGSARWAKPLLSQKKVHWCPSRFKDSVQLRERLKRIANNTARPFDEITKDGTICYGVVESSDPRLRTRLGNRRYQDYGDRIELSCKDLKQRFRQLPGQKYIIERYPNGGIIVERIPL
jgi:pyruvate formate-lyase activating enzyme-like uncharacterized protein